MYIPHAIWRRDTTHTWYVSGITKEKPNAGLYGDGPPLCTRGLLLSPPVSAPRPGTMRVGRREDKASQSQRHKPECGGGGNEEYAQRFHDTDLL
jgi:hypothetical protein